MPTDLPNLLTLSRIAAIPLLVVLASINTPQADMAACIVFSVAAITDYFDGKIARNRGAVSGFGRMLDPIADKLLVGAALMLLAGYGRRGWPIWKPAPGSGPPWRDASTTISTRMPRLAEYCRARVPKGRVPGAGDSGAPVIGLGFLPVSLIGEGMLWAAAVLTLITGWDYLRAGLALVQGETPAKNDAPAKPPGQP